MRLSGPTSAVLLSGIAIRFGLAPFTGHPYDMGAFVASQRLFYQTGAIDLKYFPTLPAVYYIQLAFYAPYQLLRLLGMPDFQYYYHTTLAVEGLFLKLPSILCDIGVFLVLLYFTRSLLPATLFFLNPFPIYLSAVWGTYDSLMLFPLLLGLYIISTRDNNSMSAFAFVLSGSLKLVGFAAFALVICNSIIRRRFRKGLLVEILGGGLIVTALIFPVFLLGGFQSFLHGLVYRFIGLSGGTEGDTSYNLFGLILNANPSAILPIIPISVVLICLGYSYESVRRRQPTSILMLKWMLVASLAFNFLSISEPQWLSWLVPLGILYGSLTGRLGLQYFAYILGTSVTFLPMTLLQGTGYMLFGTGATFLLGFIENIPNAVLLYAVMITIMLVIFSAYSVFDKLRSFRFEVVPLMLLLYFQAYFWVVIVGVGKVIGVG